MKRNTTQGQGDPEKRPASSKQDKAGANGKHSGSGSWQKIEALREKAALKASLADVWDEDFDLDEEILAELDHTAEYFTSQLEESEEIPEDDGEEVDDYFDDDEV